MPGQSFFARHDRPSTGGRRAPRPSSAAFPSAEPLERRLCLTTWYVAPDGSDIAPGTVNAPLGSVGAAAARARAGDVVLLRAGTYYPGASQQLGSIGAADGRITFQSYPGEKPVIDGSSLPAGATAVQITGQYLDFINIEIRNAKGAGITATGLHLKLINDTVDGAGAQGLLVGSAGSPSATNDVFVQNCTFTNDNLAGMNASPTATSGPTASGTSGRGSGGSQGTASTPPPAALEAYGASGVSFNNNFVVENYGIGIEVVVADTVSVSGNLAHDNVGANIALDNATHVTVNQNFLYNTSETAFFTDGAPAASIELSNGNYSTSNPLDFLLIENNITLSRSVNLLYANESPSSGSDPGMKDATIANNVFYSGGGSGSVNLKLDDSPGYSNDLVTDNIFYQSQGAQVQFGSGATASATPPTGFTFKYNNWYDPGSPLLTQGGAQGATGTGDVYANPYLANPGLIDPNAYKISSSSPDLDAGIAVDGVQTDYYGIPRPEGKAPDIGAHELVTTPPAVVAVTPPPGVPPGIPAGLAATSPSPYEIDLTWGDYVSPLAGFDVQRRGNGDWVPVGYGSAGPANGKFNVTGTFSDTGLKPNHSYTYRVFAFFADNTVSGYSKSFTFKTAKLPKVVKPKVSKPKAAKPPKKPKAKKAAEQKASK